MACISASAVPRPQRGLTACAAAKSLPKLRVNQGQPLLSNRQPLIGSQLSTLQALPSLHLIGVPPTHRPPLQPSPLVQPLPSSHVAPSGAGRPAVQPELGKQPPGPVQGLPSSHTMAVPLQVPFMHPVLTVQTLLSSHGSPLFI